MLTAQQILSSKKCGDLFSSADKQVVIAEYREIARAYHPDISSDPQANEVMAKVNQLYEEALKLIESGAWEVSNRLILRDKSGKKYNRNQLLKTQISNKLLSTLKIPRSMMWLLAVHISGTAHISA